MFNSFLLVQHSISLEIELLLIWIVNWNFDYPSCSLCQSRHCVSLNWYRHSWVESFGKVSKNARN